ncbi:MAG TPA: tripartite tricarboxylate transporter TctB family protein [Hyphomicrobiaceae bacterium]|nr:tripartite tricarboxylate transporter TctB family protein [Hyphomicrobiaceae bacterium]
MPTSEARSDGRRPCWPDTLFGLAVLALAGVVAWQTTVIPENAIYARVGPKAFPWLAATLLAVMGSILTIEGLRGGWEHDRTADIDWRSLGWLGLGLALNVLLIARVGFILSSILLFVCTARAFGSTRILRDAVIAAVLAVAAYIGFDRVLGYKIGSGLIEGLL